LLYQTQGHYAAAEPLYERSLAIKEKALGPDHPDVATSLNNLATLGSLRRQSERRSTSCNPSRKLIQCVAISWSANVNKKVLIMP
jgi:hypothetical protein